MLNHSAGSGNTITVSPILWDVLTQALQAHTESGGLVTPAILNELENAVMTAISIYYQQCQNAPVWISCGLNPLDEIEMDEQTHAIRLPSGLRLDFGGVAKGWADHQQPPGSPPWACPGKRRG